MWNFNFYDYGYFKCRKNFHRCGKSKHWTYCYYKKVNEEWNGKEFITNDVTGILEGCETYKDYVNDGSTSFYLKVDGNTYDVTDRDFYFV